VSVSQLVLLKGGPYDGVQVNVTPRQSLVLESSDELGRVARYRPGRERGVYTFRGMDTVVARIPWPPEPDPEAVSA
jgi:hypothetical protein